MSDSFPAKYKSFMDASEAHARSQEVRNFIRDFIEDINNSPEADTVEILGKLESAYEIYEKKSEALFPIFVKEMKKLG